jgi:peptidoglycan/LPS O-acetylase OafA/YrhL
LNVTSGKVGRGNVVGGKVATGKTDGSRIPSLDGLRAVSILIVFFSHALPARLRGYLAGGIGVSVFFFLSGFIITTLLRKEYDATGAIDYRGFYLRRLLRIYPPLTAMLALVFVLCATGLLAYDFSAATLGVAWLQLSNYWIIARGEAALPPGASVLWSLAVEEHFYLLFPIAYAALRRRFPRAVHQAAILGAVCVGFLAWRLVLIFGLHANEAHLRLASDARLDSILFGCILAIVANPTADRAFLSKRVVTWLLLPVGIVGIVASRLVPGDGLREASKYTVQGLAFMALFTAAIRYPAWGPLRLLNVRPAVFLGVISYSFYLVHVSLLAVGTQIVSQGRPALIAGGFVASLLVASAFHFFVERPANRLRQRLSAPAAVRPGAPADATAAPPIGR